MQKRLKVPQENSLKIIKKTIFVGFRAKKEIHIRPSYFTGA
jgi:hypothetical protein